MSEATSPSRQTRLLLLGAAFVLAAVPSLYPQTGSPNGLAPGSAPAAGEESGGTPVQMEQFNVTGTAEQGYRVGSIFGVGPWAGGALQDIPYSINVVSSELIDNRVFSTTDQIFAANPEVQLNLNQSRGYDSIIYIRGLRLGSGFSELNGIRFSGDMIMPVEDKQEVQVYSGLTGYLYGPGNAGGLVNFVTKMPTAQPFASFTAGDYGGSEVFAHVDAGGPVDAQGKFGYRLNVVGADGDTAITDNRVEKSLISAAASYRPSDVVLLQVDYSHQYYHETGTQADWGSFNGAIPHFDPGILDPTRNYSQPWTFNRNELDVAGINLTVDPAPSLRLRAAYQFAEINDENIYTGNNVSGVANGVYAYSLTGLYNAPKEHLNNGGYAFADYSFSLGPVANKLTAGYYTDSYLYKPHEDETKFLALGTFTVGSEPNYVPAPVFTNGVLPVYTAQNTRNQNFVAGDEITFTPQLSGLVGIDRSEIDTANYATTGAVSSRYDKAVGTPSGSLIYKPAAWLSLYGTYLQSLVNSGTAAATYSGALVTNAGQAIAPTISDQYEVGVKGSVGAVLLTAALFQIDEANTYYETASNGSYTFTTDGQQRNRGLELTASGKITRDLTVVGGVDFMNSIVTKTNTAYLLDQPPYGAAQQMGKLYAEYAFGATGLTLDGGVDYVGRQVGNAFASPATAREWLSSYATFDLGGRYQVALPHSELIFRLNVTNVGNRSYWQQTEILGAPRSVAVSVTIKL